jgi:hypothetical protein
MDTKRKMCDFRNWQKRLFFYIDTLVPSLYQFVESRNIEEFWLFSEPLPHLWVISETFTAKMAIFPPSCEPLYSSNTSHLKEGTFVYEYPLHRFLWLSKMKQNKSLLFGSIFFKHGRHFDYWNRPLNMRMRICYLDYHEAGLGCYLVIHIKTYYVHYRCLTSICDLFTDSPSYKTSLSIFLYNVEQEFCLYFTWNDRVLDNHSHEWTSKIYCRNFLLLNSKKYLK